MTHEDEVRDEACGYLGREITDEEWRHALPLAKQKLERIISREGDLNGERRKSYYLGKLVQERISEDEFSNYTVVRSRQIMMERSKAHETATAYA